MDTDQQILSKLWYGKARATDTFADIQKSNELLKEAIEAYVKAVEYGTNLPDAVFKMIAQRCLNRMTFIGKVHIEITPSFFISPRPELF